MNNLNRSIKAFVLLEVAMVAIAYGLKKLDDKLQQMDEKASLEAKEKFETLFGQNIDLEDDAVNDEKKINKETASQNIKEEAKEEMYNKSVTPENLGKNSPQSSENKEKEYIPNTKKLVFKSEEPYIVYSSKLTSPSRNKPITKKNNLKEDINKNVKEVTSEKKKKPRVRKVTPIEKNNNSKGDNNGLTTK